jgi:nucleoside-triphosphatase
MKNVFLTGDIKVGKSTIINKVLAGYKGSLGGFRTVPYLLDGRLKTFVLESVSPNLQRQGIHFICRDSEAGRRIGLPDTFEEYGVRILKHSLAENAGLIIMDELGIFESAAVNFQKQVFAVLESAIPVLGVLKAKPTTFLDEIRDREDVTVVPVSPENRDELGHGGWFWDEQ